MPLYAETLERPVDRFLTMLRPGRLAMRLNWSLMDDATLHRARRMAGPTMRPRSPRRMPARRWCCGWSGRSSGGCRKAGTIAFGIRIHITPLHRVVAVPGGAARLREAVLALPPEMQRYKSLLPFRAAVLGYLEGLA